MSKLNIHLTALKHLGLMVAMSATALMGPAALAQNFPAKPVKLVVPYPPGGPVDGDARGCADRLSRGWNQPVLVENRGGGNEVVAVAVSMLVLGRCERETGALLE